MEGSRISNWKEQVELLLVISWLVSLFGNDGLTKLVVRPKIIQGFGTQHNSSIGKLYGTKDKLEDMDNHFICVLPTWGQHFKL